MSHSSIAALKCQQLVVSAPLLPSHPRLVLSHYYWNYSRDSDLIWSCHFVMAFSFLVAPSYYCNSLAICSFITSGGVLRLVFGWVINIVTRRWELGGQSCDWSRITWPALGAGLRGLQLYALCEWGLPGGWTATSSYCSLFYLFTHTWYKLQMIVHAGWEGQLKGLCCNHCAKGNL